MKNLQNILQLYFIMGSSNCIDHPTEVLKRALQNGITLFQFREKGQGSQKGESKFRFAKECQCLCKKYQVPFIVNDDIDLALSLDADGIHIGQEDGIHKDIRRKIGNRILGISAHNLEEAKHAIELDADYLGVGPMFPTKTKLDCRNVEGPKVIKSIRDSGISIPIVGIGGINELNLSEVLSAGANGIAVISSISKNPENASKLSLNIKEILNTPFTKKAYLH